MRMLILNMECDMFENMSAIILTRNPQNFYSFCYFGIESDCFYFHKKISVSKATCPESVFKTVQLDR